jgi:hypothetical protein
LAAVLLLAPVSPAFAHGGGHSFGGHHPGGLGVSAVGGSGFGDGGYGIGDGGFTPDTVGVSVAPDGPGDPYGSTADYPDLMP